jgi:surfactin synthase thioesterase subunit
VVSPWLVERGETARARVRILAVPFAGAGASALLPWASLLPADVALTVVRLPGRENRFRERQLTSMAAVIDELAPLVLAGSATPTVVFGYSLGAFIGYELTARLHDRGAPPVLLAVGGAGAPHLPRRSAALSTLNDAAFVRAIKDLEGTPPEVFEHPELLELVLPTLRADFALLDGYTAAPRPMLTTPIVTYSGADDPELTTSAVAGWGELTGAGIEHRRFPGGHFFLTPDPAALVAALLADIDAALRAARERASPTS